MSYPPARNQTYPPTNDRYDDSEATTSEMGERFEDEPGQYNNDNATHYTNDRNNNDGRSVNQGYDNQSYAPASIHPDDAHYQPDPSVAGQSNRPPADDDRSRSAYSNAPSYRPNASRAPYDDRTTGQPDPYDRRGGADQAPFEDHDPYSNPHGDDENGTPDANRNDSGRYTDDPNAEPEQAPPAAPEPRQHKYSTANLKESGKWKKWCSICLIFLLFLAFMIGLSMLFDYLFFGDVSDNGPTTAQRDENGTFPQDKQEIDAACGRSTFLQDDGALCKEACIPQYFECCDPFDEFKLYNFTKPAPTKAPTPARPNVTTLAPVWTSVNGTNMTNMTNMGNLTDMANMTNATNAPAVFAPTRAPVDLSSNKFDLSDDRNTSFMEGFDDLNNLTCSFDQEVRGCMAYAKCQAITGQADPSSNNLPDLCSFAQLEKDPGACQELCRKLDCCFSLEADNCMAEKFDLCMDYAPCQNLKKLNAPVGAVIIETAPRTLDYDCFWQMQGCFDSCEKASCCGDRANSCFQANFMACLTYAPCSNVTLTSIVVPPQFSVVAKPPNEIVSACNAKHEHILQATTKTCEEICTDAACCFTGECFHDDPLGCMAWDAQCQTLLNE